MAASLVRKREPALFTYVFGLFLIGIPFAVFGTYIVYQIQFTGFLIGTDADGMPCMEYCLVPFGSQMIDVNSVMLYLNALGFGLGGVVSVFISAYADYWPNKSVLIAILIAVYGLICIPAYWLREPTVEAFNGLMALYVVYAVVTYIIMVVINMFIPHGMRGAQESVEQENDRVTAVGVTLPDEETHLSDGPAIKQNPESSTVAAVDETGRGQTVAEVKSRAYGFLMSIWGTIGSSIGGILALVIGVILSAKLEGDAGQSAGLLLTTAVGFLTVLASGVLFYGLPKMAAKPKKEQKAWWIEVFMPFYHLTKRKNMACLLLSYTIYVDASFAVSSVTSQLFFVEIKPNTMEYSLYAITSSIFTGIMSLAFYYLQSWRPVMSLEKWLIVGYAMILVIPIWGCIGLAETVGFGFKYRWEFYVQNLLFCLSNAITSAVFRVIYSEFMPKGSEVEWFGLQVVLSCATAWISYIASAPLQNATNQLRFPLIICLVFLLLPVGLEIYRITGKTFRRDKLFWKEQDKPVASSAN